MMSPKRAFARTSAIALIAWLLWGLWSENAELRTISSEIERLEKVVGRIDITDPNAIAVSNVVDGDAKEWSWRVYLPAGKAWRFSYQMTGAGGGYSDYGIQKSPEDMLVRCRIIENEGTSTIFIMNQNGSSTFSMPNGVAEFLQQHWNELIFDVAATERQLRAPSDKIVSVFSITVPDHVMPLAKQELDSYTSNNLKTYPLFKFEIGSVEAFEDRKQALQSGTERGESS